MSECVCVGGWVHLSTENPLSLCLCALYSRPTSTIPAYKHTSTQTPTLTHTPFAAAVTFLFSLTAGFSPPYPQIGWYLRWVSWVNPVAYVLEGLVANEFRGGATVVEDGVTVDAMSAVQETFRIPRYPLGEYGDLNTPEKVCVCACACVYV